MKTSTKQILYTSFTLIIFLLIFWFALYTLNNSDFLDFHVFYSSAQMALQGNNIYRTYSLIRLPYWYFPWVSWFFIPLTVFPFEIAKIIYILITFLSIFFIIHFTGRYFNQQLSFANQTLITSMSMLMCWLLFRVGQMDFILAALITATIFLIDKKQNFQAGLFFPIFLFKPHLLIVFIPFAILRGGKRFLISAAISMLIITVVAFILIPNWPVEMMRMLNESGRRTDNNRWGFTTFAALIGREENWSGTGNLPITIILILLAYFIIWKNQHLPTVPFLAYALSVSLLCAPRAYSYNFPFLIPSLLWLSAEKTAITTLLWLSVGIIALATNFSTEAYLIVMATCLLSFLKARKLAGIANEIG